jgi:hypothetical protein
MPIVQRIESRSQFAIIVYVPTNTPLIAKVDAFWNDINVRKLWTEHTGTTIDAVVPTKVKSLQ